MADAHFTGYVYIVTNIVNGKQYVGQTRYSLARRWHTHLHHARIQAKSVPLFIQAIRKHGPDAFTMEALCVLLNTTQAELDAAETELIATRNTVVPNGYNLRSGGCAARCTMRRRRR